MSKYLVPILIAFGLLIGVFLILSRQSSPVPLMDETGVPTQGDEVPMADTSLTINLNEQNDSGEMGVATLVEEDGMLTVTLSMEGFTEGVSQPAHIHVGACPEVGAVKYPLTNVMNGVSVTKLNVTLAQLDSELPLGINIHKSAAEAGVYTACGDL